MVVEQFFINVKLDEVFNSFSFAYFQSLHYLMIFLLPSLRFLFHLFLPKSFDYHIHPQQNVVFPYIPPLHFHSQYFVPICSNSHFHVALDSDCSKLLQYAPLL